MAVGWFGSTARRRSRTRWPQQPTRQAPTSYCKAIAHIYTANGRRECPDHVDRARRRHSGELRAAVGPYPVHPASQIELGEALRVRGSCCGGNKVARRELVPSMATAEPLCCCWGCCDASDERRRRRRSDWKGRGARLKQWTAAVGSGRPRRVDCTIRRPATRVPHAAGVF